MTTIWRLTILGSVSGAIAGSIVAAASGDSTLLACYGTPGTAFGIIIGGALVAGRQLRPVIMLLFLVAAGLSNAAAVFCGTNILDPISDVFRSEIVSLAVIGLSAGIVGATLLTFAAK